MLYWLIHVVRTSNGSFERKLPRLTYIQRRLSSYLLIMNQNSCFRLKLDISVSLENDRTLNHDFSVSLTLPLNELTFIDSLDWNHHILERSQ